MSVYKITALRIGTLYADKHPLTMGRGFGEPYTTPIWSTAIEGNGLKALVDTGIHDVEWVRQTVGAEYRVTQEEDETMQGALAKIGWTTDDVQIVINTHLHYDHAGCNYLFKNAIFYAQRIEWEYSYNAIKNQKLYYAPFLYDWSAVRYTSWKMLDGECEVRPGIVCIPAPGHTPGSQAVLVSTEEGVVCIGGDAINLPENINENVLPNIIYNCEAGFHTLEMIRNRADRLMGGHDGAIQKYQTSGFPRIN